MKLRRAPEEYVGRHRPRQRAKRALKGLLGFLAGCGVAATTLTGQNSATELRTVEMGFSEPPGLPGVPKIPDLGEMAVRAGNVVVDGLLNSTILTGCAGVVMALGIGAAAYRSHQRIERQEQHERALLYQPRHESLDSVSSVLPPRAAQTFYGNIVYLSTHAQMTYAA
jgi:hypothetical protein